MLVPVNSNVMLLIHRQFRHSAEPGTVTVAGKLSLEAPPGTLNNILKQAGLK